MKNLRVNDPDYHATITLAEAWGIDPAEVYARALRGLLTTVKPQAPLRERIRIHGTYKGTRTEGEYYPDDQSVKITSGELAGKVFTSPSQSASAVVAATSPDVTASRNGWTQFWKVTETGEHLDSLRK
ncbi:hypothetical protein IU500_17415 [Nocardia terpenica]|uniref:RAMA domain-containing protein n=1 Tax=Nocardia terpenica TaxID=455432 RepID=A0A164KS23_9NOCA|nr:hypothetical protein [Nocardia terpenica]KZM71670.1 hypothetical protein AWN90_02830 [Nocardia terpenica]MBF6063264.1 hypothetical protein [Nocardia terpenica]MBF6105820.1 hypothetical protein [Nocardia terpenica]MBF6113596.1 hypothetical protein [Nocardia terpenica]MBF6119561.1 hypothetical protein [Nocardia terpenica]